MKPTDTKFDVLKEWGTRSDTELQAIYSQSAHDQVVYFLTRLGDELERKTSVDDSTFVPLVRKMHERYREGSRLLGEAIVNGLELRDRGRIKDAALHFRDFVDRCPSECYREVAEHYLLELMKNDI